MERLRALAAHVAPAPAAEPSSFSWEGLERDSIEGLSKAFLVVRGIRGWIGCGYISADTASRLGDAAAIYTGVSTHDDMLAAEAVAVSEAGEALGLSARSHPSDPPAPLSPCFPTNEATVRAQRWG